ncbi:MAG: S41 family peptidase [Bacteroidota bacterium]
MKQISRYIWTIGCISLTLSFVQAQTAETPHIAKEVLGAHIDSIANMLEQNYISAEMGAEMASVIREKEGQGGYDKMTYQEFGKQLTWDLRAVSGDVHMSAYYDLEREVPRETLLSLKTDKWGEVSNYGYTETKILEDNIGYLRIAHFTKWTFFEQARERLSASMKLLQNTDALIIDLRDNPGGFEDIVAFLSSYFLGGKSFKLQEYYCRYQDRTTSIYTTEQVPGNKMEELPLFILVNEGTGSAAESFAYILKHLDRATVIGDTTAGGGNGSTIFRISKELVLQVAVCETFNAVTQTSWEKVGVIPHITTQSEDAFKKAKALAKGAAKQHRSQLIASYEVLLKKMELAIEGFTPSQSDTLIIRTFEQCHQVGLINESVVNSMGYEMLGGKKRPHTAEVIFKANTMLYPNSANTYDSYAESLLVNGKLQQAIENYQSAVDIGTANEDPSLSIYRENLEKAKKELAEP